MIQSGILIISALFAVIILIVDIIFALVDPRIRSQYVSKKNKKNRDQKGGTSGEQKQEAVQTA